MSTTVTYKGDTLATVSNATKTLKTAGKYMEGDVTLTDVSRAAPTIQSLSITPSESAQTFNASGVDGYKPVSVSAISSTYVGSEVTRRDNTDLDVSTAVADGLNYLKFTAPSGYYASDADYWIEEAGLPSASISVNSTGLVTSITALSSRQYYYPPSSSQTTTLQLTTQAGKTVTPTESEQTAVAANTYTTGVVKVGAISSTYVGSGIARKSSTDLTVSGATVTAPAGYYAEAASTSVTTMTLPTSTAASATSGYTSKATVGRSTSDQYINIAPGYNTTGAYYKISAVPDGSLSYSGWTETESDGVLTMTIGKTFTAGYLYSASDVKRTFTDIVDTTITPSTTQQVVSRLSGNTFIKRVTVEAMPSGSATAPASISGTAATVSTGTNTLTLTKTVSVTPTVSAGYVSAGTAGNSSVSLTASVTVNPTPTASGATVTIPAGYYSSQTTKSVTSGSASAPSTISGTSATVSTGTNTLTLTKTVSITPTVSAGYVSAGTATNSSVSLTASITTKAAATITPTTTNQTIASGTYLTGTQTIEGDADLVGGNILSTANIFGVQGTVVVQNYYTGSSAPSSSLGSNGDIYVQQ